jgi:predicted HTH domain antitoxin
MRGNRVEDVVIRLLEEGRISKGYATQLLDVSYYDIDDMLEARGIRLGLTEEQHQQARKIAQGLKARQGF